MCPTCPTWSSADTKTYSGPSACNELGTQQRICCLGTDRFLELGTFDLYREEALGNGLQQWYRICPIIKRLHSSASFKWMVALSTVQSRCWGWAPMAGRLKLRTSEGGGDGLATLNTAGSSKLTETLWGMPLWFSSWILYIQLGAYDTYVALCALGALPLATVVLQLGTLALDLDTEESCLVPTREQSVWAGNVIHVLLELMSCSETHIKNEMKWIPCIALRYSRD